MRRINLKKAAECPWYTGRVHKNTDDRAETCIARPLNKKLS